MMNKACNSNCKNEKDRSTKYCICGGHNHSNPKKNKHHNSTKQKLLRRFEKRFIKRQKDIKPEIVEIVNDNFFDLLS